MATTDLLLTAETIRGIGPDDGPAEAKLVRRGGVIMMVSSFTASRPDLLSDSFPAGKAHRSQALWAHSLQRFRSVITERQSRLGSRCGRGFLQLRPGFHGGPLPLGYLPVPPDLVFEVLSPSRPMERCAHQKVAEYLHAGVRAICVVDDSTRSIHVFHGGPAVRRLLAGG